MIGYGCYFHCYHEGVNVSLTHTPTGFCNICRYDRKGIPFGELRERKSICAICAEETFSGS